MTAKFSNGQRVENKVKFEITVRDENDNSPVFSTPIEKPLPENSQIGKCMSIITITVSRTGVKSLLIINK